GSRYWVEIRRHARRLGSRWIIVTLVRDISQRKAAEGKLRRQDRVHAVLSGINSLIVRVRSRDELFSEACRIAVEVGAFRMAWVGVLDPRSLAGRVAAWHGEGFTHAARFSADPDSADAWLPASRAIQQARPMICNDIAADDAIRPLREAHLALGFKARASFPLVVSGRPQAVITLFAAEANVFDAEETRFLEEMARNLSFALEHIDRTESLDRVTRMNAMLSGINGAIVHNRDRKGLFREACRIAVDIGGLALAWISVVDEANGKLRPVAFSGVDDGFLRIIDARLSLHDAAPEGHGSAARAVREARAIVVNDAQSDGGTLNKQACQDRGLKSHAAVPLVFGGRVAGAFTLHAAVANFFDVAEMRMLNEVAANIALALEHIVQEERLRRLTRVYAVLSQINSLIVRATDRIELLREACRIAVEAGAFRIAWVAVLDGESLDGKVVACQGAGPDFTSHIVVTARPDGAGSERPSSRSLRDARPVLVNNIGTDASLLPIRETLLAAGCRSVGSFPLMVDGRPQAVIVLYSAEPDAFDEEEMHLLHELSGNLSLALEHLARGSRLDYLAYYDPLTGLANRTLFLERVNQYIRSAAQSGHELAVFLVDLERFKNFNDTLGRSAGDQLLKQVADWLARKGGDASLVARVGADQFAMVLPEMKPEVAHLMGKTIAAFLDHPFRLEGAVYRVFAKVGVAAFPRDGAIAETLMENAEAALKRAKASGDRFLFYNEQMTAGRATKLTLENQLREALRKGEFVLHYQPKIDLANGTLTSCEALIRWNDPATGLVPPGRFIPVLEETGLIHEVGRWALRQAVADYLRWRAAGLPSVRIAVNVSPLQLRDRGFIAEIEEVIAIDQAAAAGLELEITETLIMEDVKHSIATLRQIRALGLTIAIDDFGTGFSSLSYLAKLPVDTLKIDRSFVIDMTSGPEGLALVSTIINLAHSLKLKVVAEGVETPEQSRLLRLLDCDEIQGFLHSKALPTAEFEARFLAAPVPK
ncbi:MAG: GGDEF domain-containing protein, partial [Usitatibacter sp.]